MLVYNKRSSIDQSGGRVLKYIQNKLEQFATLKSLLISMGALIISALLMNGKMIGIPALEKVSNGVGLLGLQEGYNLEKAYELLELMGQTGRRFYLTRTIPLDMVFSTAYGITLGLIIMVLFKKLMPQNEPAKGLALMPIVAMFLNYMNNTFMVLILTKFPEQLEPIFQASFLMSMIRSSLIGFSLMIIGICLMVILIKNGAKKVGIR